MLGHPWCTSALTSHFPHAGFVVDGHTFENTSCVQEVFGSIKLVFQIWVSYNYVTNLRWQYDLMWDFLCQLEIRALLNSTIFTMLPSFLWVLAVGFFLFQHRTSNEGGAQHLRARPSWRWMAKNSLQQGRSKNQPVCFFRFNLRKWVSERSQWKESQRKAVRLDTLPLS